VGITPWALTTGDMANVRVNPAGNSVAYSTDLAYEFVFSPNHEIPLDGLVEITIPSQILIPDPSFSSSTCSAPQGQNQGFPSEFVTCVLLEPDAKGKQKLQILNAFKRISGRANAQFKIVMPGITNPINTSPTDAFVFTTYAVTVDGAFAIDSFEGANI
jgi:hypothetical protein